jgi:hypothetical protein
VEHEGFEGRATVRHYEEPADRSLRAERLFHRPAPGDELLALLQPDRRFVGDRQLLVLAGRSFGRGLLVSRWPLVPGSPIGPLAVRAFVGWAAARPVRAFMG